MCGGEAFLLAAKPGSVREPGFALVLIRHAVCLLKELVKWEKELKACFDPVCQLRAAAALVEGVHTFDGKRTHIIKYDFEST